jgi:hypothetical protein
LHPAQIGTEYTRIFRALGTRLETQGKERLVVTGVISQSAKWAGATNVQVVTDTSGQLRVDASSGVSASSVVFNGQNLSVSAGAPGQADQTLADTLSGDTVEHFLFGQKSGNATRLLAVNARVISKTVGTLPTGPPVFCDLYQVSDRSTTKWSSASQLKVYCFDSATHLLRSVSYQKTGASGGNTQVQTYFSDWRSIESPPKLVPWKIERYEDGSLVLSLSVQSAVLAATASDALFNIKNQ